jgi:hypothetical protein
VAPDRLFGVPVVPEALTKTSSVCSPGTGEWTMSTGETRFGIHNGRDVNHGLNSLDLPGGAADSGVIGSAARPHGSTIENSVTTLHTV